MVRGFANTKIKKDRQTLYSVACTPPAEVHSAVPPPPLLPFAQLEMMSAGIRTARTCDVRIVTLVGLRGSSFANSRSCCVGV